MISAAIRAGRISPVNLMRAALMDLGFAGLIEKIEERFGRGVTTALLAALCLVVFAWVVHTVVAALAAIYEIVENGGENIWLGVSYLLILFAAIAAISWVISYTVFARAKKKRAEEIETRVAHAESIEKQSLDNLEKANSILENGKIEMRELEAQLKRRLIAEVEVRKRAE